MSIDLQTDWDGFNAFVDSRRDRLRSGLSLEEMVGEFRTYQRELATARAKIRESKERREQCESTELDVEQLIQQVQDELAAEGIRE
jgi:hypothetical protein